MADVLPSYIQSAQPNPPENRAPWYKNTAPSYAGIFLSVAFLGMAPVVLANAGIGLNFLGLLIGALCCFGIFYVPGMLGMKTGYPLYIVGASTFGTVGGYALPGLLMGILQIGWHAVFTFLSTQYVLRFFGVDEPKALTIGFIIVGILWGYTFAYVGVKGIRYLGTISIYLPIVPLAMIVIGAITRAGGIGNFTVAEQDNWGGFAGSIDIAIGFFATAGAAGADFGMSNRHKKDVVLGGLTGVGLACLVAGLFAMLVVAGAKGMPAADVAAYPDKAKVLADVGQARDWFPTAIGTIGGFGGIMFLLFALASICPTSFCAFIAGNSFSTMFPKIGRLAVTMGAATIGVILAVTGAAGEIGAFFGLIGASFGPIVGAMTAEYILNGGRWSGPRAGVNIPGYVAWAVGFIVGILPNPMIQKLVSVPAYKPATVLAFVAGFVVYLILGNLRPQELPMPGGGAAGGSSSGEGEDA